MFCCNRLFAQVVHCTETVKLVQRFSVTSVSSFLSFACVKRDEFFCVTQESRDMTANALCDHHAAENVIRWKLSFLTNVNALNAINGPV